MKDRRRIKRLIGVRERIREVRKAELAEANHRRTEGELRLRYAEETREVARRQLTSSQNSSAAELLAHAQLISKANESVVHAKLLLKRWEAEVAERQEAMIEASRDVKTLEHIDEKLYQSERSEKLKREQFQSDEAAARISRGIE